MNLPPAVAFAGRDKWVEVAVNAGLAVGGTLLVLAVGSQLSGGRPVGLLLLVVYTAYAVAVTAVLTCVAVATSQLPTLDLVLESDSMFGKAWASVFVVLGVVAVLGAVVSSRPLADGAPLARASALVTLMLLACWAAVVAAVGAVEENWLWPVVLGVPAAYLLWAALRLWRHGPRR